MKLPDTLLQAIEQEITRSKRKQLNVASQVLTKQYREDEKSFKNDQQRLAYLAVRMPATYAAVYTVFKEIKARAPHLTFQSLLDMGAGPGTVMWAAKELFPHIADITLIEKDQALANFGKSIALNSSLLKQAKWLFHDINVYKDDHPSDLITLSYVLNELSIEQSLQLVDRLWNQTKKTIVIIEPGTPKGFSYIRAVRARLIELGAHLVAPCPHMFKCPMKENDWCHFAVRLDRTAAHRQIKDVSLSYEDEKFSYVVACREPVVLPKARVLRHPQKRSGHVNLVLCQADGQAAQVTFSRKQGELYQHAKKLEWGDVLT